MKKLFRKLFLYLFREDFERMKELEKDLSSFIIQGVQFDEEYSLPYRTEERELLTEEERLKNNLTHIQAAKGIIAKDLNSFRSHIEINQIVKIHNSLIID